MIVILILINKLKYLFIKLIDDININSTIDYYLIIILKIIFIIFY